METFIEQFTRNAGRPLIRGISEYDAEIETLNRYLRGEISAVETYDQCIDRIDDPEIVIELAEIRASHELRSEQLHNHIRLLGGRPRKGSGIWGAFARLVEGGAKLFGTRAALEALENGEALGIREYENTSNLRRATLTFVRSHLQPEQAQTHTKIRALLDRIAG